MYDPQDTRTLPLHPVAIGREVSAVLPDGTTLEPGPDGLFPRALPLLTRFHVQDVAYWRVGPEGLGPGEGNLTPEDAAAEKYPRTARAHALSVEYLSDELAVVTVDTVPSFPLRTFCFRERGLWVVDPRRSEQLES
jgi:hypothetical protein